MSALTTTSSPMVRLIGKRPLSISGSTPSIITREGTRSGRLGIAVGFSGVIDEDTPSVPPFSYAARQFRQMRCHEVVKPHPSPEHPGAKLAWVGQFKKEPRGGELHEDSPEKLRAGEGAMRTESSCKTEKRRCGALQESETAIRWRVWAPNARRLDVVLFEGS